MENSKNTKTKVILIVEIIGIVLIILALVGLLIAIFSGSNKEHEHVIVVDAAVEPTCSTTGLTEGRHCSDCGEIIQSQEVIPIRHAVSEGECILCGTVVSVENYSFETGDLSGWTFTYGTGNGQISMEAVSAETTYFNEKAPYNQTGEYHFNGLLANENEVYGYVVKSSVFNLTVSGYISFKMGGNAARIKVYKADGTQIAQYDNTAFNLTDFPNLENGNRLFTMTTFVADLSQYRDEDLYVELVDKGVEAQEWGHAYFDEIVTYYKSAPVVKDCYDTVEYYKTIDGVLQTNSTVYNLPWAIAINTLKA